MDNIIVCVLKTGGIVYDNGYVNALAEAVARNTTVPYEFVCLTDSQEPFLPSVHKVIQLEHAFPGWWSKIELFSAPYLDGKRVTFFDLDTVITSNIDFLFEADPKRMVSLSDFYFPERLQSAIMQYIGGSFRDIYTEFMKAPIANMRNTAGGDQEWIEKIIGKGNFDRCQTLWPNRFVSFKVHLLGRDKDYNNLRWTPENSVVCFHGVPKPENITNPIIANHWKKC